VTIDVRQLRPEDVELALAIAESAYGRPVGAPDMRLRLRLQPQGWRLAYLDGSAAGIGGITNYGSYAVIGLMGTRPELQGRGVGAAILRSLLEAADSWRTPLIGLDATEAGAALYPRFGFVEADRTSVWNPTGLPVPRAPRAGVEVIGESDRAGIAALDARIFGAPRKSLLEVLMDENPGRAFMLRRGGETSAYLVAQRRRIGPGVAGSRTEIGRLLDRVLAEPFDEAPDMLVPDANRAAPGVLSGLGFRLERSLRYMLRGGSTPPGDRSRLLALANFAFG
jgi:GNAT superfamily N-acetyltransferase